MKYICEPLACTAHNLQPIIVEIDSENDFKAAAERVLDALGCVVVNGSQCGLLSSFTTYVVHISASKESYMLAASDYGWALEEALEFVGYTTPVWLITYLSSCKKHLPLCPASNKFNF